MCFDVASPDGRQIAYQRETGSPVAMYIWIAEADGSGERKLTEHQGLAPIWSPDGSKIAYYSADDSWQLAVAGVGDPTSEKRLGAIFENGWTMTWTPDGTRIIQSPNDASLLVVIDPTGREVPVATRWEASRAPTYQRLPFEP